MLNTFVEVTNFLDILGDIHTNPIPETIVDMKSKIFINNSSLILDLTPRLTHQKSSRYVIQILVDQPSHDNMVFRHWIEMINICPICNNLHCIAIIKVLGKTCKWWKIMELPNPMPCTCPTFPHCNVKCLAKNPPSNSDHQALKLHFMAEMWQQPIWMYLPMLKDIYYLLF